MSNIERYRLAEFMHHDGNISQQLERICEFYEKNRERGNRVRDITDIIRSLKSGSIYYLEDSRGQIFAASANFSHFDTYTESGGTLVKKEVRGFGLQRIFHDIKFLKYSMFEAGSAGEYFCVIAAWNDRSIDNMLKCGFEEWRPDNNFSALIGKYTIEEPKEQILYFKMRADTIGDISNCCAKRILNIIQSPILTNKRTGNQIIVSLDVSAFKHKGMRDELELRASRCTDE